MARKKFKPPLEYTVHFDSNQMKALREAFEMVKGCIPKRPTHPILGCYKLEADHQQGTVTLTAFDLRECLSVTVEADVSGDLFGNAIREWCIPELVREMLPDDEMWVTTDDESHQITLVGESGRFETSYVSASEYPQMPHSEYSSHLLLSSDEFIEADRLVSPFASPDEAKQILQGVNIQFVAPKAKTETTPEVESQLKYATMDGHRAAVYRTSPLIQSVDDVETTIPVTAFSRIAKLIKAANVPDVRMTFDRAMVSVNLPNIRYSSRLLEGQYPKYEQLIPRSFEGNLTADAKEFKAGLEVLQKLAKSDPKRKIGKLAIASGDEDCVLSGEVTGTGAVIQFVPATVEGKGDIAIGFNVDYLSAAVKVIKNMNLHYNSPTTLLALKEGSYTHLIMPVQFRS